VWASALVRGTDAESRPPSLSQEEFEALRPHFAGQIRADVETYRQQYLNAARDHLRSGAV
jgi:hypothetical protein